MNHSSKDERFISDFRFASWLTPRPEDTGFRFELNKNGTNLLSDIYLFIKFNSTFNVFSKRKKEGMNHATF